MIECDTFGKGDTNESQSHKIFKEKFKLH